MLVTGDGVKCASLCKQEAILGRILSSVVHKRYSRWQALALVSGAHWGVYIVLLVSISCLSAQDALWM